MNLDIKELSWLPPFRLRESQRAKYVNIRLSSKLGMEIVVPTHVSEKTVIHFLKEKRAWIEKNIISIKKVPKIVVKPKQIILKTLEKTWDIQYEFIIKRMQLIERPDNTLIILGDIDKKKECMHILKKWIRQKAEKYLLQLLTQLSKETNLPYQSLQIRGQNTRWGSCSEDHNISLNYKLLFLPYSLTKHIILHELCHTRYMNHSKQFWSLLERLDSEYEKNKKLLKQADHFLPDWVS